MLEREYSDCLHAYAKKKEEFRRLEEALKRAVDHASSLEWQLNVEKGLKESSYREVEELLAAFPVYRSYLPDGETYWTAAVESARAARPDTASGRIPPQKTDARHRESSDPYSVASHVLHRLPRRSPCRSFLPGTQAADQS